MDRPIEYKDDPEPYKFETEERSDDNYSEYSETIDNSFFFKDTEPLICWKELPVSHSKEYVILMFDVAHGKIKHTIGGGHYFITQRCKLLHGFENLEWIDINKPCFKFDFPYKAFRIAWEKGRGENIVKGNQKIDCLMKFRKRAKNIIDILDRKLISILDYEKVDDIIQKFIKRK